MEGPTRRNNGRRSRSGERMRRICFTLNNWTQEEYDLITEIPCRWMIVAKETGENGTQHLQGAIILGTQMSFSAIKMLPGLRRAHLEQMFGKPEDSDAYCRKQDLDPFVKGTLPTPGKRTDIHEAVDAILEGSTLRDLAHTNGVAVVKFSKGLTILRSLTSRQRDGSTAPLVFWLWGETGVGKTRSSIEFAHSTKSDYWISSGGLRWFDGYDGQAIAIIDDFRAKHLSGAQGFAWFLRLLDRYPMQVEFKGGYVNWAPDVIIITTTKSPRDTFATRAEFQPEDLRQLERRISWVFRCTL